MTAKSEYAAMKYLAKVKPEQYSIVIRMDLGVVRFILKETFQFNDGSIITDVIHTVDQESEYAYLENYDDMYGDL